MNEEVDIDQGKVFLVFKREDLERFNLSEKELRQMASALQLRIKANKESITIEVEGVKRLLRVAIELSTSSYLNGLIKKYIADENIQH